MRALLDIDVLLALLDADHVDMEEGLLPSITPSHYRWLQALRQSIS